METSEAAQLLARTVRHFAHKVVVTTSEREASIETRFGRARLVALEDRIAVELEAPDAASLGSLRKVIVTHLTRFARTPTQIRWPDDDADAG